MFASSRLCVSDSYDAGHPIVLPERDAEDCAGATGTK